MIRTKDIEYQISGLTRARVLAIGHVVTQWAALQEQIDQEITELGKLAACVGFRPAKILRDNVENRLAAWRDMSLAAYSDDQSRAWVEQIWREAEELRPERDAAVHAIWGTSKRLTIELRQKRGEPASIRERPNLTREMEDCAKRISQINALHLRLGVRVADMQPED